MRGARIRIIPEYLRDALHLPDQTEIHYAEWISDAAAAIELVIVHPDLPAVNVALTLPLIEPMFEKSDTGVITLKTWKREA